MAEIREHALDEARVELIVVAHHTLQPSCAVHEPRSSGWLDLVRAILVGQSPMVVAAVNEMVVLPVPSWPAPL